MFPSTNNSVKHANISDPDGGRAGPIGGSPPTTQKHVEFSNGDDTLFVRLKKLMSVVLLSIPQYVSAIHFFVSYCSPSSTRLGRSLASRRAVLYHIIAHLEYSVQRLRREGREPHHREVSEQPRGHVVPPPPWRSTRCNKHHVLNTLEEQLLGVVKATRIYGLWFGGGGCGELELWAGFQRHSVLNLCPCVIPL